MSLNSYFAAFWTTALVIQAALLAQGCGGNAETSSPDGTGPGQQVSNEGANPESCPSGELLRAKCQAWYQKAKQCDPSMGTEEQEVAACIALQGCLEQGGYSRDAFCYRLADMAKAESCTPSLSLKDDAHWVHATTWLLQDDSVRAATVERCTEARDQCCIEATGEKCIPDGNWCIALGIYTQALSAQVLGCSQRSCGEMSACEQAAIKPWAEKANACVQALQ